MATWTATPLNNNLYQQALAIYQTFFLYDTRARSMGGVDEMPPQLAPLLMGNAYGETLGAYRFIKDNYVLDGTPQFATTATMEITDKVPDGTVVAVGACEDTWGAVTYDKAGHELTDDGVITSVNSYYFKYNDQGDLAIFEFGNYGHTCNIIQPPSSHS
jgi:hypothetical protein